MIHEAVKIDVGPNPISAKLDAYFVAMGMGMNFGGLRRARLAQIIELELKSDRDLRRMGLRREEIAQHVFRDLLTG